MKDLPAVLSSRPATTFYSENGNGIGYSTLRIRGFDQRRIAVSINGIPQNDPEDFNVFWINFFDIDGAVEDIQIQRGAGASEYGSVGIGGAINVVALPYRPFPYAELSAAYGSFDTRRISVEGNSGLIRDRYVFFGRYSRLESDGYRRWSWTEFDRFFVGATRYGARSALTVQAYGGPQRDGLAFGGIPRDANSGVVEGDGVVSIDRRYNPSSLTSDVESFHQPHVEIHHQWARDEQLRVNQSLFWVKGTGYFDFGANFRSADYLMLPDGFVPDSDRSLPLLLSSPDSDVLFRANLVQWQVGWIPRLSYVGKLGETELGAEVRLHRSERWVRIQEATGIPADRVGSEADRRVYQFRGEKLITSLSAGHVARPWPRVAVEGEALITFARYRTYDDLFFGVEFTRPYVFLNPRIGFTVNPERTWSGYASISLASREPRLKSLYDGEEAGAGFRPRFELKPDGNLDLDRPLVDAEHLFDFELGVSRTTDRSVVALSAFWMEFVDEIVPSGGLDQFGVPRTGNAERTRHVGVESEWRLALGEGLQVYGNFTIGRARYRRFEEFGANGARIDREGNPIPGFPSTSGNLEVRYRLGGWRVGLFGRYAGRQHIDNSGGRIGGVYDESLTVDPYVLADAAVSHTFGPGSALSGLSLGIDVNNVLDREVLLFGNVGPLGPQFFPAATRHMLFRVSYVLR
jgi:iron complex outermembrane receptor protein